MKLKKDLSAFKYLNTTEYAIDIEENDKGKYDIKIYKLEFQKNDKGDFYFCRHKEDVCNLESVYNYLNDYPLGPSCFINELYFIKKDSSQYLTSNERLFMERLEILSRTKNIRKLYVYQAVQ